MNFSQLVEQVRLELKRRIERGTLSVSLLARQTGLGQAHVSNFLHGRRGVKAETLDRILSAQRLSVEDLVPTQREGRGALLSGQIGRVVMLPVVTHEAAMFERYLRVGRGREMAPFQVGMVSGLRPRCPPGRKEWERFVVVRLSAAEAAGMSPVVEAGALLVVDRHYTSLTAYEAGKPTLYAVRVETGLMVRYAEYAASRLVLRPVQIGAAMTVVAVGSRDEARGLVVGRVVFVGNVW
jgi:hypothetical protein